MFYYLVFIPRILLFYLTWKEILIYSKISPTFSWLASNIAKGDKAMDWNSIPEELLQLILSNLFVKDRYSFSLVCRSWDAAVGASPFCSNSPCLMFNKPESNPAWKFFQHNTFFNMDSPKLKDAVIRFSNHGWLLMTSRDNGTLFFYHYFNNHIIQLPTPNYAFKTICFFHPPTSPECFVVGIATEMVSPYDMMRIGVLKHGESDWKKSINHNKYHAFMLSAAPPIFCNGILLFLDVKGNVGVFNIYQ
ncbi:hypothetical protein ACP275_03G070700 [Erythranthe tilingii]